MMMKIYYKDLGLYAYVYDIQALKGGFVFASILGELVEMVKKCRKQYNIVKRWSNPGPTSRFEIDSTLSLSQLVISNISRSG